MAVFLVAVINGVAETVYRSIISYGFVAAVDGTFGISVIVYACVGAVLYAGLSQVGTTEDEPMTHMDWLVVAFLLVLVAIPHPLFSWLALTVLALRERFYSAPGTMRRSAAVLALGVTIPLFWGRVVLSVCSGWVLKADAALVALTVGSRYTGNIVDLPDGRAGFLSIGPPCSSLANMSLAVLCWLMFTEFSGRPRTGPDYATLLFALLNVIIINVARISLIARRPDLYDTIHGPTGSAVVSWLTAAAVLAVCAVGSKRGPSGDERERTLVDAVGDGVPARGSIGRA